MNIFKNLKGHFCTITHHKMLVMKTCFKVGLYKQGLLHDLSKYTPIEFIPGIIYYQGDRSPINREKELKNCSRGWLHHKGRNLHHFEYWIDYSINPGGKLVGMKMPKKYVAEMVIDRISASKNYLKEQGIPEYQFIFDPRPTEASNDYSLDTYYLLKRYKIYSIR